MAARTFRTVLASLLLLSGLAAAVRAEPIPAPTEQLKDFQGRGVILLDLPAGPPPVDGPKDAIIPGISMWVEMRQAYVWPDRILTELNLLGNRQVVLVQGNTELTYSPGTGLIIERLYKNLEHAPENPMTAVQISMATYAKLLQELQSGKMQPEEDTRKLEAAHKIRIAQLQRERAALSSQEDLPKYNALSAEMVRIKNDLDQLPFRREHPCHVVEFANKDVIQHLFAKGLTGNRHAELLSAGKSTFWVTKAEGLPVKIETTDNTGRVAISVCFTELKVNQGLRPSDLTLNASGARRITLQADIKDRNWEEKMEKELGQHLQRLEDERQRRANPRPAAQSPLPTATLPETGTGKRTKKRKK